MTMSIPTHHSGLELDLQGFQDAVNRSFVALNVSTELGEDFRGSIAHAEVHRVGFSDVRANAHTVERTPELIRQAPRRCYKISLQLEGVSRLSQGGREVTLTPGDLAIYDTTHPYRLTFESQYRCMVVQLPHERLRIPAGMASEVTAVRMAGSDGLGRVVSPFLATLVANLSELQGPAGARLAQNAIDLLDTLFAAEFDLALYAANPHRVMLQRIRDHIDAHIGDDDLSPTTIAAQSFVSVRHLHNLFHEQGQTVAAYVRSRRLERCYLDLTSTEFADVPVGVIGQRWGFKDPAHFSRAFKQTYGESPGEARRRAVPGA